MTEDDGARLGARGGRRGHGRARLAAAALGRLPREPPLRVGRHEEHGRPVRAERSTPAIFLKEFVPKDVPWAHLDVAGVAHFEKEQSGWPPGASGFGVALTMEFLRKRFGV